MSEQSIVVYEKLNCVMFKTDIQGVYDTFYLGTKAVEKLFVDLNQNRVVKLGKDVLASRNFERSVPYEAVRVPDKRVRFEVAHKIHEYRKKGKNITPGFAYMIEMNALVKANHAMKQFGVYSKLQAEFTKSTIHPVRMTEEVKPETEAEFFIVKKS